MGTSSWLDKYKADLAAIVAKGSTTKVKSPYEIANLVASTPRLASEADLKMLLGIHIIHFKSLIR